MSVKQRSKKVIRLDKYRHKDTRGERSPAIPDVNISVLAAAWGEQGEGQQPALAALCATVASRGVRLLRMLSDLARKDRQQQRRPAGGTTRYRPPRPQLPSSYPAVWR